MEIPVLIPSPDSIPAPAWLFLILDLLTFTLHILLINVIIGGSLIILYNRFSTKKDLLENQLHEVAASKIPSTFALGINLGVAPLLFLQVIYGHLFYASSVLMALYWILVIPLLILAYYGAYLHIRKYQSAPLISKIALLLSTLFILYIAFTFVNNMTLMTQPEKWQTYFGNRNGTILNVGDPTFIPRYLHFIVASIAIAGLFMALVWSMRLKKGVKGADAKMKAALKIFGFATIIQVIVGLWFLISIPQKFLLQFMGGNLFATLIFMIGFLSGIGAIATAFANKLRPTLMMVGITIIAMVLTRHNLREMYLGDFFNMSHLTLEPQYGVMALFFVVFVIGLLSVGYMVRLALQTKEGRARS
jgi:hypothetical protein